MALLDRMVARSYDPFLRAAEAGWLGALRRDLLADVHGHVLELGAGTGANLPHIGPAVTRWTALEPSEHMARRLEARIRTSERPVELVRLPAEAVPLPSGSVDTVVATLVLCTVHDPATALREARRVLRPGGSLHVIEHVAATGTAGQVQQMLAPAWRVVGRGCDLHRETGALIERAGFDVTGLEPVGGVKGGRLLPFIAGRAVRS